MKGLARLSAPLLKQQNKMVAPMLLAQSRSFRQVHDLNEVVYTAQAELEGRTAKYLERTDKVYKPS
jgi:hypothetical protein